jgi:xanthine dehydrogenase accessory factor
VVAVEGSSYRRPGARMLIGEDRWVAGSVSGGCLEGDLLRRGWWRAGEGGPTLVTYDSTGDDELGWGLGLGCNGVVHLLLERLTAGTRLDPLAFIAGCVASEATGVLVTVFRSGSPALPVGARLARHADGRLEHTLADDAAAAPLADLAARAASTEGGAAVQGLDGGVEALVEVIVPPPHLFVCGARLDAVPVVALARGLGWTVSVLDRHARWATRERFTGAHHLRVGPAGALAAAVNAAHRPCAVVMAHDYQRDRDYLGMLLRSRARYIGVLGPRRRTDRLVADLIAAGTVAADVDLGRLHAPVGLQIGAESPDEIALAIVAEVQATLARASARHLRDRRGAIHDDGAAPGRLRAVGD